MAHSVRVRLEQLGVLLTREPFQVGQGASELGPRLAVGTELRSASARGGCQAQDRVGVPGLGGVVRERGEVGARLGRGLQDGEHLCMEGPAPGRRDRHRHGLAGQFVPERQEAVGLVEQSAGEGGIDRVVGRAETGQQRRRDRAADDAGGLDDGARVVGEA
jgi:hypothetical protein